ncbi:MAG: GGDEF domain-containing protein [Candidatus Thiodiazotropha sp.]
MLTHLNGKSLPTRLLLPVIMVAIGGVLLLAVSAALWTIHKRGDMIEAYHHREAHLIAEGLANAVAADLVHQNYASAENRLLQAASSTNLHSVLVTNTQGDVLSYVIGRTKDTPAHADFSFNNISPPDDNSHDRERQHPDYLEIWHEVKVGSPLGWVRLEIGYDFVATMLTQVQREAWLLALAVAIPGILLLGGSILRTLYLMQRREQEVAITESTLKSKAYYDSLTGLPNRHLLLDRFEKAIAHSLRHNFLLAVCFIDLDNYKPINDRFGHAVGDRTLLVLARRFKKTVRGADTAARLGGDEFIILLNELQDETEAELAVERIMTVFQEPLDVDDQKIDVKASIGYALYPVDSKDAETLIELADKAMYRAKSAGRGRIYRFGSDKATTIDSRRFQGRFTD